MWEGELSMPHRDFNDNDYMDHYRNRYGTSGNNFDYYRPAYRFGYDVAHFEMYRNRDWDRIERDARRTWEHEHPDTMWDDVKDAVRDAWERIKDTFD